MKKIDTFIKKRKENFRYLYDRLKPYEDYFVLPKTLPQADPSWFAFPLTVRENSGLTRKGVVDFLEKNRIMTRALFSGNLTKHPAYMNVNKRVASSLKVTDNIMNHTFFFGVYPGISKEIMEYVGNAFDEIVRKIK